MKDVLIVVDMQRDFVDGALGTEEARRIVPALARRIRGFDGRVILTMDTHDEDYPDTQEGKNLPVPHCVKGSDGWRLDPDIRRAVNARQESVTIFEKPAFASTELALYLKEMNRTEGVASVELAGLCTDVCVISNAILVKAFLPEVPVKVNAVLCAGVTPQRHLAALEAMAACQVMIEGR
ncbi:MAG: cysteine hydrolase family protein [Christensenellales bacterium]|jgi:nicotinamidase-related amidase